MARRLTIGVLIEVEGTVDIEGYKTVLRTGIADCLREEDCHLICFAGGALQRSPYALEEKKRNLVYQMVQPGELDGLVVIPTIGMSVVPLVFREFLRRYEPLPIVSAGSLNADYPSVYVDNRSGIESLCRHLFEYHRFKNPIFIAGPRENPEAKARLEVYRGMLARHGLPDNPQRICEGAFTVETGRRAVQEIRSRPDLSCDTIICANDHMALGAILELTQQGVEIPDQIAVTGFDDDAKALAALPPLTTVRQPIYEIGREAARMVLDWIHSGDKPKNVQLPTRLVTRQSCGCEEYVYADIRLLAPVLNRGESTQKAEATQPDDVREQAVLFLSQWLEKPPAEIRDWLNSLSAMARESDLRPFLRSLKKFLRELSRIPRLSGRWQETLSLIKIYLLPPGSASEPAVEIAMEKARVVAMEYERNRASLRKLESDLQLEGLNRIGRLFYEQFELKGISKVIKDELPALGVSSFLAALFDMQEEGIEGELTFQILPKNSRTFCLYDSSPAAHFRTNRKIPTRSAVAAYLSLSPRAKQAVLEPLFYKNRNLGFFLIELGPREGFFYETLRSQMSGALFEAVLFRELRDKNRLLTGMADRDSLTGLYNHLAIFKRLQETLEAAKRNIFPITFLMIDIDDFQQINDTFGHIAGDEVLRAVGAQLRDELELEEESPAGRKTARIVRPYDVAGRYGGDEFCIILPYCGKEDGQKVAERIFQRITFESHAGLHGGKISLSMGVAALERGVSCNRAQALMQLADFALYRAKQQGKARIEVFSFPHSILDEV
jgi:sigma-B regulation protein RsbU (phosphoserine phosphatase)